MAILDYRGLLPKGRVWVVLGKGPTFSDWRKTPGAVRSLYHVLGLNHVNQRQICDVMHFTDWSAFVDCRADIRKFPGALVMPWRPHVDHRPGSLSLSQRLDEDEVLQEFDQAGRLGSYNSSLAKHPNPNLRRVPVRLFSAVAGVSLLLEAGVKEIVTAGIDGGTGYAKGFDDKDRLANGRSSFDAQFPEIERLALRAKAKVTPLFPPRAS